MLIQGRLGSSLKLLFKHKQFWKFGSGELSLGVYYSNSKVSVFTAVEIFRENYEEGLYGSLRMSRSTSNTRICTLGTGSENVREVKGFRVLKKKVNHSTNSRVNILYHAVK
jgi:hypothetical protein